jgi:integration host factor subunit beta
MAIPAAVQHDIDAIVAAVDKHDTVSTRVGTFRIRRYKAYIGRNPRTGGDVPVPEKRWPFAAISDDLANAILGSPMPPSSDDDDAADDDDGLDDDGPGEPEAPASVHLACDALFVDLVAGLTSRRRVAYSGFGNFVRRKRTLEFTPSQVWKARLNDL